MISLSQAFQDLFALQIKDVGTYIEVGANLPKKGSNTYNLEVEKNWRGFSIELDTAYKSKWDVLQERKNKVYWSDATTFDYASAIKENNMPMHVTYLSCDIEPPENTFKALKRIIEQGITFDCITFEHDAYQSNEDFNTIATEFLLSHGYKIAVSDVFFKTENRMFETWYVLEPINFKQQTFKDWKKENNL